MVTPMQMTTLLDLIDAGTQGNFPSVKAWMIDELGYEPEQVVADVNAACAETGRDPMMDAADWSE